MLRFGEFVSDDYVVLIGHKEQTILSDIFKCNKDLKLQGIDVKVMPYCESVLISSKKRLIELSVWLKEEN